MVPLLLLSCCCYSHQLATVSKFCFRLLLLRPHTLTHQQEDESGVEEKEKRLAFFLSSLAGTFGLQNCSVEFGIVYNMGLLLNQQHAADAQVQLQEQDACRYVTCPGAQPVGTELLPEDIIAPLSDLYPHRLWGKPEEDLPHRPKYLLTLTVGLKQKDFVNQCLQDMQSFKNHGLEISQPGLEPGQEEQWSRTVGVKIPISPHVQGMSFSEHFNFCSMVTNEVVLHELCMFNEMMDIQLGYVFVVAGL
ncbi:unnamed protein product [Sphagnum troendelagicum]